MSSWSSGVHSLPAADSQDSTGGPSASVLLVESDDRFRRHLFWMLYLEGLKVLTARDPEEARHVSRDVPGPLRVLIIGSLPAGADAAMLQRQLEMERPELRTVFAEAAIHSVANPDDRINGALPLTEIVESVKKLVSP